MASWILFYRVQIISSLFFLSLLAIENLRNKFGACLTSDVLHANFISSTSFSDFCFLFAWSPLLLCTLIFFFFYSFMDAQLAWDKRHIFKVSSLMSLAV